MHRLMHGEAAKCLDLGSIAKSCIKGWFIAVKGTGRLFGLDLLNGYNRADTYMRQALIIAGILLAGPVHATPSPWLQKQTENMHRVAGPFLSTDYGFSIEVPPKATEYVTNGGDANHGPILILGEKRKITVYPEYTSFNDKDAKPCRRNQFPWEPGSKRAEAVNFLNGHRACVVTFTRGNAIWRVMQTAGTDRGTGIMYTLLLTTTAQWSRNDFLSFQRVADSFRRVPITP